jgi:hypothetical protein
LSDFNTTWVFWTDLKKKKAQLSNFMKIRPVGAELFHAGGRTYRHVEANSGFSQFPNAPEIKCGNMNIISLKQCFIFKDHADKNKTK